PVRSSMMASMDCLSPPMTHKLSPMRFFACSKIRRSPSALEKPRKPTSKKTSASIGCYASCTRCTWESLSLVFLSALKKREYLPPSRQSPKAHEHRKVCGRKESTEDTRT